MPRPTVIFVGDREWPEFIEPVRWLVQQACVSFAADLQWAAAVAGAAQEPPDLFVVAQPRPGVHTPGHFDALRSAAPLAPIVCMLGSHCESEGRTGKPWPGALRVYAHQFIARVGRQFERVESQSIIDWALPFTMTEEDRLLGLSANCDCRVIARVAVFADRRETASALGDLLGQTGCTVLGELEIATGDAADVAIWDSQGDFAASRPSFERLVKRWPHTAKVVLMGFPRVADQAAALACGASAVVSKPFLVQDLLWQIRQCLIRYKAELSPLPAGA
jgi:hypothetical protein